MAAINGGPAFPRLSTLHDRGPGGRTYDAETVGGMSLRDYFAAQALPLCRGKSSDESVARFAYSIADAMLNAREQK